MKRIKLKKITPLFTGIVTTMDKYDDYKIGENGLIDTSKLTGTLKEYQTVIAVGSNVRGIEVGNLVSINPSRYAVREHNVGSLKNGVVTDNPITGYLFTIISLEDKDCLLLLDNDIEFVVNEYEEVEEEVNNNSPNLFTDTNLN